MSWHTGIFAVRGAEVSIAAVARRFDVEPAGGPAGHLDDVTDFGASAHYLAEHRNWVLAGNFLTWDWLLNDDADMLKHLARRLDPWEAVAFIADVASTTHGFALMRSGTLRRDVTYSHGRWTVRAARRRSGSGPSRARA